MIDRATIAKINEAAQIYDVVSEFVNLKKSGSGWKGLCPFHDDRSPSFTVYIGTWRPIRPLMVHQ